MSGLNEFSIPSLVTERPVARGVLADPSITTWAVWGLGRSGVAVANLLAGRGYDVIASDTRTRAQLAESLSKLDPDVRVHTEANVVGGAQAIVLSPGMPPTAPAIVAARARGLPMLSEIEIAWCAARAPMICITGTDGKTTTTSLIGAILERDGREVVVAGNIGTPLCEVVEDVSSNGLIVAEVSAFQLWSVRDFAPHIACLTNLADDHLDYFGGDMEAYVAAKKRMIERMQGADAWFWIDGHDVRGRLWAEGFGGRVGYFGLGEEAIDGGERAVGASGGAMWSRGVGESDEPTARIRDTSRLGLHGPHNLKNMACAAGMARCLGVSWEVIARALEVFEGLPHRFERCGELGTIDFIDDSKATNAHAALAGLRGLDPRSYVAIVGGVDKGLDLSLLATHLAKTCCAVVCIGEMAQRIAAAITGEYSEMPIEHAASMEQAVRAAVGAARRYHARHVVLSPAASSFDMFDSYAHRGQVFQQCVHALSMEQGS